STEVNLDPDEEAMAKSFRPTREERVMLKRAGRDRRVSVMVAVSALTFASAVLAGPLLWRGIRERERSAQGPQTEELAHEAERRPTGRLRPPAPLPKLNQDSSEAVGLVEVAPPDPSTFPHPVVPARTRDNHISRPAPPTRRWKATTDNTTELP